MRKSNTLNPTNQIVKPLSLLCGLLMLSGCLASTPKKSDSSRADLWQRTSNTLMNTKGNRFTPSNPFQLAGASQQEISCHDRQGSGSYSEDTSAECVRSQTLRAYRALGLQMDPEIPYCILRQESSKVKNNNDPYDVDFDRLAICRKGKKYCGVGMAQFTFGTWSGYSKILATKPEQADKLTQCLNTLSAASSHPKTYSDLTIKNISPSMTELLLHEAKTKAPTDALNPFYRDHAICMNALHLSEMPESLGRNGRSQSRSLGATYNGGGTAGYGSAIGKCVAAFRAYDRSHQASADSFHLMPDTRRVRSLATSETSSDYGFSSPSLNL